MTIDYDDRYGVNRRHALHRISNRGRRDDALFTLFLPCAPSRSE
jgi:hypothetical protein